MAFSNNRSNPLQFSALSQFVDPTKEAGAFFRDYANRVRSDEESAAKMKLLQAQDARAQVEADQKTKVFNQAQDAITTAQTEAEFLNKYNRSLKVPDREVVPVEGNGGIMPTQSQIVEQPQATGQILQQPKGIYKNVPTGEVVSKTKDIISREKVPYKENPNLLLSKANIPEGNTDTLKDIDAKIRSNAMNLNVTHDPKYKEALDKLYVQKNKAKEPDSINAKLELVKHPGLFGSAPTQKEQLSLLARKKVLESNSTTKTLKLGDLDRSRVYNASGQDVTNGGNKPGEKLFFMSADKSMKMSIDQVGKVVQKGYEEYEKSPIFKTVIKHIKKDTPVTAKQLVGFTNATSKVEGKTGIMPQGNVSDAAKTNYVEGKMNNPKDTSFTDMVSTAINKADLRAKDVMDTADSFMDKMLEAHPELAKVPGLYDRVLASVKARIPEGKLTDSEKLKLSAKEEDLKRLQKVQDTNTAFNNQVSLEKMKESNAWNRLVFTQNKEDTRHAKSLSAIKDPVADKILLDVFNAGMPSDLDEEQQKAWMLSHQSNEFNKNQVILKKTINDARTSAYNVEKEASWNPFYRFMYSPMDSNFDPLK